MPELSLFLDREAIRRLVADLAGRIAADYQGRRPVLIGVLKGAFVFLSDLIRRLTIPVSIDFIGVSSYGARTVSSGKIRLTKPVDTDLEGKDVLLVEDIVDSGFTLSFLKDHIEGLGAKSVKVCALLDKRERREESVVIDYTGLTVKEGFLVGYGLDFGEDFRYLPEIHLLKPEGEFP